MTQVEEKLIETKYDVKSSSILSEIAKGYSSRIVGEENNVKLLWCACISKDLPKEYRLSAIITSPSSAGKSNLLNTILTPFKDDVIDYTDYTPAFLQRQEMNMNGKIFKMEQMERTNDKHQVGLSNLKFLLSEGKLRMGLVDNNDKGKKEPRTLEVNGIPVFLSTSTNYSIDPESLNRTLLMQVDETEEQTKLIMEHIVKRYSTLRINDAWEKELLELKNLAKLYKGLAHEITDVMIPFGTKLLKRIPTTNLTIRRDLAKILNLTNVITFIHASNRIRIRDNEGKDFLVDQWGNTEKNYTYALVAEPSDFKEAFEIAGQTIKQTINKINEASMKIYDVFLIANKENDGNGATIKDLAKLCRLSDNRTRELMKQLVDSGFLIREKQKSIREYTYFPSGKQFEEISTEDIEFTKEELEEWLKNQTELHPNRLEVVYPNA